jgi:hypothetical protein
MLDTRSSYTDYTPPGPWSDGTLVTRNRDGVGFIYNASFNALMLNPNMSASLKDGGGFSIQNVPLPRTGPGYGNDVANRAYVDSKAGTVQVLSSNIRPMINGEVNTITAGTAVYVSGVNTVKMGVGSAILTSVIIGLVLDASITAGALGNIVLDGIVSLSTTQWGNVTGSSGGLITGASYFLNPLVAGGLVSNPPTIVGQVSMRIGIALSTTDMELRILAPVLL